jgi:hypothetical protein
MNEIGQKKFTYSSLVIESENYQVTISKTNFIYLFRNLVVYLKSNFRKKREVFFVYKSKMTAENYLAAIKVEERLRGPNEYEGYSRTNILNHFSLKTLENKLDALYLRGPLAIGISKSKIKAEDDEDDEIYDDEDE